MLIELFCPSLRGENSCSDSIIRIRGEHGFSLIEMCVVMVIMAIIAVASVPIYLGNKAEALAPEGEAVLASYVTAALRYRANNGTFVGAGHDTLTAVPYSVDENTTANWTFAVNNVTATSFQLVATDTFDADSVFTITLNYDLNGTPHQTLVENF